MALPDAEPGTGGTPRSPKETAIALCERGVTVMCRVVFYIAVLGLKFPLGQCMRASWAKYVMWTIVCTCIPGLVYCHYALIPLVRHAEHGLLVWHGLTLLWITIPLLVVGFVILKACRVPGPFAYFGATFAGVLAFHRFVIPFVMPTAGGTLLLHSMLLLFEDLPMVAWIWALYHTVKVQEFVAVTPAFRDCPIGESQGPQDRALIVGNAPNVLTGRPLGRVIDGFNHVVRFNSYHVAQPAFTGSKTTHHFYNGRHGDAGPSGVRQVLPLFYVSLTHAVYLFFPKLEAARQIRHELESAKGGVWVVDEARVLALRKKLGIRFNQVPSSGMVAIDAFLSKHQQVHVHGFSFFQGKTIHYFEESVTQMLTSWLERIMTHSPDHEKRWVEALIKKERVHMLSEAALATLGEDAEAKVLATEEDEARKAKERQLEGDGKKRPTLFRSLIEDGMPSQFSL